MLWFTLKYKIPRDFSLDTEIDNLERRARGMAEEIERELRIVLSERNVDLAWEVLPFGPDIYGQPDFDVKGYAIGDSAEAFASMVARERNAALMAMQLLAHTNESVRCTWIFVNGESDCAFGKKPAPLS
ncbi:hypothetical protein A2415_04940 [candidate division WWE3 bacterium RIFOXYC1_FULL_39_7]|uniref:Uncharacterized protein n=2 Tax=Katanobacteria TaxID=422282 RepID=A0A1F4X6V7_UNCKA|nr:MAG: hypothetical protein A2415_04940 [candidate division WWE3 bacterium RIFOXYC1_FULL_39_7]OGC77407.1 MAG: hypothetical protein A2619_03270 [candidate division WWE3 bacterium RIFOXYD1_FULL_39_9]